MQLIEQTLEVATTEGASTKTAVGVTEKVISNHEVNWTRAFNTSILSTSIEPKSSESDLESLLSTPEYTAILLAAQSLAEKLQVSPEAATERLIQTFRSIDICWEKILLKKGAQALLGI